MSYDAETRSRNSARNVDHTDFTIKGQSHFEPADRLIQRDGNDVAGGYVREEKAYDRGSGGRSGFRGSGAGSSRGAGISGGGVGACLERQCEGIFDYQQSLEYSSNGNRFHFIDASNRLVQGNGEENARSRKGGGNCCLETQFESKLGNKGSRLPHDASLFTSALCCDDTGNDSCCQALKMLAGREWYDEHGGRMRAEHDSFQMEERPEEIRQPLKKRSGSGGTWSDCIGDANDGMGGIQYDEIVVDKNGRSSYVTYGGDCVDGRQWKREKRRERDERRAAEGWEETAAVESSERNGNENRRGSRREQEGGRGRREKSRLRSALIPNEALLKEAQGLAKNVKNIVSRAIHKNRNANAEEAITGAAKAQPREKTAATAAPAGGGGARKVEAKPSGNGKKGKGGAAKEPSTETIELHPDWGVPFVAHARNGYPGFRPSLADLARSSKIFAMHE